MKRGDSDSYNREEMWLEQQWEVAEGTQRLKRLMYPSFQLPHPFDTLST